MFWRHRRKQPTARPDKDSASDRSSNDIRGRKDSGQEAKKTVLATREEEDRRIGGGVDPEHESKPDSPTDLKKRSWKYILT